MMRVIFVLVAGAIGITAVTAQTDPISTRKDLMKKNSQHAKAVSGMVKGSAPYDQAAVNAAYAQWSETAAQLPKLFPENSSKGETRALPKIWSDRAGFDAQIAAFAKAAADKPADAEGLKKSFAAVNKVCGDCHEGYRAPAKK